MKRWYLYPFSLVYNLITAIRNLFFNIGLLYGHKMRIPVIGVGNLSVGGTGKSPVVMYLADLLSKNHHRTGVLSRGYGRKSKGYIVTNYSSNYKQVGDEAMQLFTRFKNRIVIAVCEDRVLGAKKIIEDMNLETLVLDDSYQHRYIKPGFNILLTDYSDPYFKDFVLPAGNLREARSGYKRANAIIVTKCPDDLSEEKKKYYISRIAPYAYQKVFFGAIDYDANVYSLQKSLPVNNLDYYDILLITGIANPKHILKELGKYSNRIKHLKFKDHYSFTDSDINKIISEYQKLGEYKMILTTEKDFVRLKTFEKLLDKLYYWPINVDIDKKTEFNQMILDYVRKN
ncbi:tetraacyldisaccharide 4'-kinase [Elizabethkingia sp. JS20170427COW]|uniref:tetraacyldisaccharide 4'-kinase n=1 Tax=Elizabethkingia sp. JS20170427COW TaxID=2583851 RepID=UPI0011106318|nr:tetraacyldisaccharide 4'-kinase [Elizabethkingia sp. JS20170427COW]QCX52822.1 tetraacyldisaccharide 4'-kinase [Elizabethkingia sp. JS20170427COW]